MPWGYLAGTVITGLIVLLTVGSPRRPFVLARVSSMVAAAANEAPIVFAILLAASAGIMASDGGAATPVGVAGLAMSAATIVGLVIIVIRATRTRPALEAALDDGLGAGWRDRIDHAARSRWDRRTPLVRSVLFPFPLRDRSVELVRNIAYGPGRKNRLDVYRSRDGSSAGPVLVYLHGGGYSGGRKSFGAQSLLHRLARQGWVCVSADYRLRPRAGFREHLEDAKRAIAWAHEHAAEYGAGTGEVFAAGSSAGAHLVSICALTQNQQHLQAGFEDAETSLAGAICLYGYFGYYYGMGPSDPPVSSPFGYPVPAALPPVLIVHGEDDTFAPAETARGLAARLRAASSEEVVYAELPGAQHTFDLFRSIRFEAVTSAIDVFLSSVRRR